MVWKNPRDLKIAVVGTGAQGAAIGADLTLAGLDVTFIEQWPAHVEAMRRDGVAVNMPEKSINAKVKVLHFCQVAEIKQPFDLVLLVVKAYDSRWVSQLIEPVLAPDGLIVGVQNGMSQDAIAEVVGNHRCVGAVNRQNGRDTSWFAVGALDPVNQPRVEVVAEVLRNCGRVEVKDDIRSAKWMKLIVNAAQLVPSAILDMPFSDAARIPEMERLMRKSGYEAMQAALADGSKIVSILGMAPSQSNSPESYVDQIFDEVLKTFMMPDTLTTVLQDWRKGRRGEVRDINGFVVSTLQRNGMGAPVNERVLELALAVERGSIPADASNLARLLEERQDTDTLVTS